MKTVHASPRFPKAAVTLSRKYLSDLQTLTEVLRYSILLPLIWASTPASAQAPFQDSIRSLFETYSIEYAQDSEGQIQYHRIISGDLNLDGLTDAIVEYGVGLRGANGIISREALLYLKEGTHFTVLSVFEPDFCMQILSIENSLVYVEELEACALPWPEVISTRKYRLDGNELIEVSGN